MPCFVERWSRTAGMSSFGTMPLIFSPTVEKFPPRTYLLRTLSRKYFCPLDVERGTSRMYEPRIPGWIRISPFVLNIVSPLLILSKAAEMGYSLKFLASTPSGNKMPVLISPVSVVYLTIFPGESEASTASRLPVYIVRVSLVFEPPLLTNWSQLESCDMRCALCCCPF